MSKLFLSCDLTGSTGFKQRSGKTGDTPWQKVFLQFYREFPQHLFAQQKELSSDDLQFELWKAVGDELIFTCSVESEVEICRAVDVWIATLAAYKSNSLQAEELTGLGVKGGIFLGTFPGPDSESTIPLKPDTESSGEDVVTLNAAALAREPRDTGSYLFDFFGPSIDTGFRVIGACSARFLTLSVEVAFALALVHEASYGDGKYQYPGLKMMASRELKGVWGGRDYPVFAIDLDHQDSVHIAMSRFLPATASIGDVKALCEACYHSEGLPFFMYLPKSSHGRFLEVPTDPLAGLASRAPDPGPGDESMADDPNDGADAPEDLPTRPAADDGSSSVARPRS